MNEDFIAVTAAIVWATICAVIDIRSSNEITEIEGTRISPTPSYVSVIAACLGIVVAVFAPKGYKISAAILTTGMTFLAYADFKHLLIWEDVSIPMLLIILATQSYENHGTQSAAGAGIVGGGLFAIYYVGKLLGRKTGVGDILPIACIGATFGATVGAASLAVTAISLIVLQPVIKRVTKEIPMGPGILIGSISGIIFERFLPNT